MASLMYSFKLSQQENFKSTSEYKVDGVLELRYVKLITAYNYVHGQPYKHVEP